MVRGPQYCGVRPVDGIQVLVAIPVLLQLGIGGFPGQSHEQRLVRIPTTARVHVQIGQIEDLDRWLILEDLFLGDLGVLQDPCLEQTLVLLGVADGFHQFRRHLLDSRGVISQDLHGLLKLLGFGWIRDREIPVHRDRHFLLDCLPVPANPDHHGAFIHSSTHVLVNEADRIDLVLELPVDDQLVLSGSRTVFPAHRTDGEQLFRTQEWLGQRGVAPFRMLADELGLDRRTTLAGLGLGGAFHMKVVQPPADLRHVGVMRGLGVLHVMLQIF